MALGDALRAERDVRVASHRGQALADVGSGARVDRAPQDHERSRPEVGRDLVDGALEHRHGRGEELVHRSADDDHDLMGPLEDRAVGAHLQAARLENIRQELLGACLEERHLARGDAIEGRLAEVVDPDAEAGVGEGQAQRQPDVASSPQDHDIEVRWHGETVAARCAASTRADGPDAPVPQPRESLR